MVQSWIHLTDYLQNMINQFQIKYLKLLKEKFKVINNDRKNNIFQTKLKLLFYLSNSFCMFIIYIWINISLK